MKIPDWYQTKLINRALEIYTAHTRENAIRDAERTVAADDDSWAPPSGPPATQDRAPSGNSELFKTMPARTKLNIDVCSRSYKLPSQSRAQGSRGCHEPD